MDTEQIVRKESMEVVDDDGHQRTGNQLSPLQKSLFFFLLCVIFLMLLLLLRCNTGFCFQFCLVNG